MKPLKKILSDIFSVDTFNDIPAVTIGEALNDANVRAIWLNSCFDEIIRINKEVDKRLLSESTFGITDLCARRKAYEDILQAVLSARRQVTQEVRPNPRIESSINLDRVTA